MPWWRIQHWRSIKTKKKSVERTIGMSFTTQWRKVLYYSCFIQKRLFFSILRKQNVALKSKGVFTLGPVQCPDRSQIDDSPFSGHPWTQQMNSDFSKMTHRRTVLRPVHLWFILWSTWFVKTKWSQSTSHFAFVFGYSVESDSKITFDPEEQ